MWTARVRMVRNGPGGWAGPMLTEFLLWFHTSPLVTFCFSLQLNSLGPEACRDLRDLLLHDQCQITTLR